MACVADFTGLNSPLRYGTLVCTVVGWVELRETHHIP